MRVATPPGADPAAATASAPSRASVPADAEVRTHFEHGRASPSMSDSSGAPRPRCAAEWSPTTLRSGVRPRLALWRFAIPFAIPGPRWSSVIAGRPAMRA